MNIRVREAADYVGLSKSTLDKLRCYGTGPRYFKLGRAVVYSTVDLDAWVAMHGVKPANDDVPGRALRAA
ncbi:helix-turn-helix transcriptional regulator [Bosea sp. (in: a-proteobacteria)]|uniref:helix-turn-helix transcriptional regulator n=1 Tax=Bosea sp. (in: a-proteobacteria) TaxID=1871050 RepID=UPI002FC79E34